MALMKFVCFVILAFCLAIAHGEIRVARSPQFGGGAFSQASAQAQGGGYGGFHPRGFGPRPPIFGPRPPIFGPGYGGHGFPGQGPSISISKSISIGGGGGRAQSSAGANSFGK